MPSLRSERLLLLAAAYGLALRGRCPLARFACLPHTRRREARGVGHAVAALPTSPHPEPEAGHYGQRQGFGFAHVLARSRSLRSLRCGLRACP